MCIITEGKSWEVRLEDASRYLHAKGLYPSHTIVGTLPVEPTNMCQIICFMYVFVYSANKHVFSQLSALHTEDTGMKKV